MWPFRAHKESDQSAEIRRLNNELDDLSESYSSVLNQKSDAEKAMKAMQRVMTEEGLAQIGARAAAEIADIYARGWASVASRNNAVSSVITDALRTALTGSKEKW